MEMSGGLLIAALDARLVCTHVCKKSTFNRKHFEGGSEERSEELGMR